MKDLQARFEKAQQDANGLAERPDNSTLLQLYALYKQATMGNAGGERPGAFDFVRRAKYDAWEKLRGIGAEDAMQQYVALVASLKR
jgi:acyl-CoA-binding protein